MSVNICFMYLGAPMFGAYVLTIIISSSWVAPLIIMSCPSLSLVTVFILKSILSGFPGGAVVGNLPVNAGDTGSSPGLGGSHMPRSN